MNIQHFYYVLDLKNTKNITQTAKNLYISQPTLSQQLKLLEEELGKTLFIRNTRSLSLTEDGEIFCAHAQKIVDEIEKIQIYFGTPSCQNEYRLNVALTPFYTALNINQVFSRFIKLFPHVSFNLDTLEHKEACKQLQNHKLDFAITKSNSKDVPNGLYCDVLIKERLCVAVNKQNLSEGQKVFDARDLSKYKLLVTSTDSSMYTETLKIYRQLNLPLNLSPYHTVDTNLLIQLLKDNHGIFLTTQANADFVKDKNIAILPLSLDLSIYTKLLYTEKCREGLVKNTFRQYIIDEFSK